MIKKLKRSRSLLAVVLALAMAMTLLAGSAFAADDDPGAGGGGGSAAQEFGTYAEVESYAGILIEDGTITYAEDWNGTITVAEDGEITETGLTGVTITAEEGNGLALSMSSATDVFTISDSTISVTSGSINDDLGYEAAAGVGVGVETGELWVVNSSISSDGSRSTPIYMFSSSGDEATSLVVVDSEITANSDVIWVPAFKLIANGARATILMTNNDSWFYGSTVISNNWGAISQDSVDATTYVVNTVGISTEGGYGTYLTYGMELYGSELYGGQYGIFMCGTSIITTDTGANVSEEAMSKVPDYEVEDTTTIVAAPFNAVVVHNSLQDTTMVAEGYFNNSILSTLIEDLPDSVTAMSYDDDFLLDTTMDSYGVSSGAAYFYSRNLYGSIALVRSMNADFTFNNTELRTSNGVLVQSVITYDPPSASGYLSVGEGESVAGVNATFLNGEYTGDILHQDYQRSGSVTVGEGATLTGKIVSGTYAAWLDLWSEENLTAALEEDGIDSSILTSEDWVQDVYDNLTVEDDTEYADTDNLGVDVVVEAGGIWVVTEESTLASLTIEAGGSVVAADGYEIVVYENCDTSNALLTYEGGIVVSELIEGTTYTDVRIEVVAVSADEEDTDTAEPEEDTDTAEPEEDTDTVEPEEDTDTAEPEEDTDAAEPEEDTDTAEPEEDTDAAEPEEDTGTAEPEEDTGTAEPEEDTGTAEPEEDTGTAEPEEDTDTTEPEEEQSSGTEEGDSTDTGDVSDTGSGDTADAGDASDTGSGDTADTGDASDTGSGDTADTGDASDTGSGDAADTGDTEDTGSGDAADTGDTGSGDSTDTSDTGSADSEDTDDSDDADAEDTGDSDDADTEDTDDDDTDTDAAEVGDSGSLSLWISIALLAAMTLAYLSIRRKRA